MDDDVDPMKMMNDMMARQQKRSELIDTANEITDDATGALSLCSPWTNRMPLICPMAWPPSRRSAETLISWTQP